MDRLFLDANILFSGAYRENAGVQNLWHVDEAHLLTSPYALEEARRNLPGPAQQHRLDRLMASVELVADVPPTQPLPEEVALPDKDRPTLLAALASEATHLITGDVRHFGPYMGQRIAGTLNVLRPAAYLRQR